MRISDNYVLQQIEDDYIVVPVGEAADKLHGVLKLNESGAFLWKLLTKEEQTIEGLTDALANQYGINKVTSRIDIDKVNKKLFEIGCIE